MILCKICELKFFTVAVNFRAKKEYSFFKSVERLERSPSIFEAKV